MNLLRFLFGKGKRPESFPSSKETFRASFGIDTSGPEFRDLYPDRRTLERALTETGLFRSADVKWIAAAVRERLVAHDAYRNVLQAVVRSGDLAEKEEIKARGLNPRRIVGRRFLDAVKDGKHKDAVATLEHVIAVETSSANKLHNLRRYQEAGIRLVALSSAKDERNTAFENEMNGKEMTIKEAKEMVLRHRDQIVRSTFRAILEIDGERL